MYRNKILVASGIVIVLAGSFLAYSVLGTKNAEQKIESNPQENEALKNSNSSKSEEIVFSIENFNKKDGDIFSVPDVISYTISPEAAKSKVKLLSSTGKVIYSNESSEANPTFSVYPEGKFEEGTKGEIDVEILVENKVVASKKIQVVF